MKILNVIVDEIPAQCSECKMMESAEYGYYCKAISEENNSLGSNVYELRFRRHDCPLVALLDATNSNMRDSSSGKVDDIIAAICEKYCRYPDEYLAKFHDPDDALDAQLKEVCDKCPLSEL